MVKCPFCGFANEEGALFCEQCKSDISSVPASPSALPGPPPTPMPDSLPHAEAVPKAPVMAAIIEEVAVAEVIPSRRWKSRSRWWKKCKPPSSWKRPSPLPWRQRRNAAAGG